MLLCFLTRLYNYNDDHLHSVEREVVLKDLHKIFYVNYEKGFCRQAGKVLFRNVSGNDNDLPIE